MLCLLICECSFIQRSSSVGNILYDVNNLRDESSTIGLAQSNEELEAPAETLPEISCDRDSSYPRFALVRLIHFKFSGLQNSKHVNVVMCRYTNSKSRVQVLEEIPRSDRLFYNRDTFKSSNFLDANWLSSSGNSFVDETYERYMINLSIICF